MDDVDVCRLNPSKCLNGICIVNISLNTSYCKCDPCYERTFCENVVWRQGRFDTTYVYFIVYIIELCISVLNNSLGLELFIRSRRIRRTNCGIYLIVYSVLSLLSSIVQVVDWIIQYYNNLMFTDRDVEIMVVCALKNVGHTMLVYLCIWFSLSVAFERALIICFDSKTNSSRWRSSAFIIFNFAVAGGSAITMIVYKCDWDHILNLYSIREFFLWFYIVAGITIYVLATLLVSISFARRIRRYGTENGSFIKTFLKLFYTHLLVFIPPTAYAVGYIPYAIIDLVKNPKYSYYQCGTSTVEFIIKVLIDRLLSISIAITWLLFVYPSKVYMTEFYLNTWSGQQLAKILIHIKSYYDRTRNGHSPTTDLINNAHDNRELHFTN